MKTRDLIFITMGLVGAFVVGLILPWWVQFIWIAVIFAMWTPGTKSALLFGGLILALVWLSASIWMSTKDQADIISKTGELLGGVSSLILMLITFIIAFISGMLFGWLGNNIGAAFLRKQGYSSSTPERRPL